MKNILFVCSANKQRSKTAEDYFSSKLTGFNFLSAGTNQKICEQEGTVFLTEELMAWADMILVMEEGHRKQIRDYSKSNKAGKINVLNIRDIYKYYDKELINLLEEKTKNFF